MPNAIQMNIRFGSHLARVNDKMLMREMARIDRLEGEAKISSYTATSMRRTMHVRLAWLANAG